MYRKRSLGSLAVIGIAAIALSGCVAGGGDGSDGGVTLTLWHNTQDPDAVLDIYSAYEEATGNTIELVDISSDGFEEATLTKWATGDRPDILEFFGTQAFISMLNPTENLRDLSDEEFVGNSGSLYDTSGRGADGNVYAAITNFPEVWGLYYNKQVLEDNGLEPATTLAELLEQCEVLSAAGIVTLAESGGSAWPPVAIPFIYGTSAAPDGWADDILARAANINDADSPVLGGVETYKTILDQGCMNPDITTATFEDSVADVFSGEAAYQAIHSNIAPVYVDAAGGDAELLGQTVGFTAWGATEKTAVINPGPIGTYLLPKTGDAEREAAALEFIRFVTGEHYQDYINASGTFPVIDGVEPPAEATELQLAIKAAYDEGPTVAMFQANIPSGLAGIVPLMSELIAGQTSPQGVADALQAQVESAAASMGLEGW